MKARIKPSLPHGCVAAPPSKSYAHRMMLCAALAEGDSILHGILESEDMLATLDCLRTLGADCRLVEDTLYVKGVGGRPSGGCFPCRESGSTLRFLIPTALLSGDPLLFQGSSRLLERGVGVYEEALGSIGVSFSRTEGGLVLGGKLRSGEYTLRGDVSSQFISGMLFALPLLGGDSRIFVREPFESRPYVDITLSVLKSFGIEICCPDGNIFEIAGGRRYVGGERWVEGDWSNGAALLALGEKVSVERLDPKSLQGDRVAVSYLAALDREGATLELSSCPDLAPILFAVAAAKQGGRFTGTARLRLKESDRAAVMAQELSKFGIRMTVYDNEVVVEKGKLRAPAVPTDSHGDHRIVMAMAYLGTRVGCEIEGAEAISKSYPDFFGTLEALSVEVEYETE